MPLSFDPEWFKAVEPMFAAMANIPKLAAGDTAGRRERVATVFGGLLANLPDAPEVERTQHTIKSYDGQEIVVHRFAKKGTVTTPGPALVHFHGGGMIAGTVDMMSKGLALDVQTTGIQAFSVDYRLAPEFPFPTLPEDCYAGLVWVQQHAAEFNIDPARIAVVGESAGGGLAASVALMARDRSLNPPLAKQILIYPMLDDRSIVSNPELEPFLIWTTDDNITGWGAYVGTDKAGKDEVSPYAAPARVKSVEGLPPTYIDVGSLDLFRDEDIAYAGRLAAANIPIDLHVYPGVPHAFEALGQGTEIMQRATANRLKAKTTF